MDKARIIQELIELRPFIQPHESLVHFNPQGSTYRLFDNRQVTIAPDLEQRLVDILASDADLQIFHDVEIRTSPTGATAGNLIGQIAQWMLAQTRKRNPEDIVKIFDTFFTANRIQTLEILTLWGIHPEQSIELVEGIKLVPLTALPDSASKDELVGINTYNTTYPTSGYVPKATAALVREFVHTPIVIPRSISHEQRRSIKPDTRLDFLFDIAQCLLLIDNRSVAPIKHWYQNDEALPLIGGDYGGGGQMFEWPFLFPPKKPKLYDPQAVNILVSQYVNLSEADRRRLQVPLSRLNRAMRGTVLNDVAIDLGIALESLLTQKKETNVDLSYKIRLRGTTFLAGSSDQRRVNFELFKELYNLRSSAAHGGELEEEYSVRLSVDSLKQPVSTREILNRGKIICADILRQILVRGGIPDWEAIVLGW